MLDDRPTVPDLDITLPPRPESIRRARHLVDQLTSWCADGLRTTAALLTSELASNAVLHAQTPFTVTASVGGNVVRVAVSDTGRGLERPTLRAGDPTARGGWGLTMVDAASSRWGIDGDGRSTTIWFELDVNTGS